MQDNVVRSCEFLDGPRRRERCQGKRTAGGVQWSTKRPAAKRSRGAATRVTIGILLALAGAFATGLIHPGDAHGQTAGTKPSVAVEPSSTSSAPLGRYVTKENLVFYMEFDGWGAHMASWQNTAAFKILYDTPVGEMLTLVSGQLLDRALAFFPNRRLSGPEVVTMAKVTTKFGWVIAVHAGPKASDLGATLVLRNAASKGVKPLSSRLIGWMMGAEKPRIERKDGGRTLVVLPSKSAQSGSGSATRSWAWWPEKDDLVICGPFVAEVDRVIAALDGKAPSAVEHPLVQELKKSEGSFEPICLSFVDLAHAGNVPAPLADILRGLSEGQGVERIDLRWGFDNDALMSVTRVIAPKPWKSFLAVLDQPTFEKTSLMAMPESVDSFIELSLSPSQLVNALEQVPGPAGAELKTQIDQLSESIKTAGSIDLKKDILGHLGPRMVAYLASGRSATTNDDSLEAALKQGLTTTAVVTIMQSYFPKLTLVADVDKPEMFGKGLDTAMIAINNEMKALALEKESEQKAATEKSAPAGGPRAPGGRGEGGGDRTKRRRPKEVSYPHFQATIAQVKTEGAGSLVKTFVLTTPSDSPLRFGPSSFRPTILLEDKHVAFAVSLESARAAIAAAKRKDWKPSSDLEQTCAKAPSKMVMLMVNDVREGLSSLLASLPGTVQTVINTSIALGKTRETAGADAAPASQPRMAPGMGTGDLGPRRGGSRSGGPGRGPMTADSGRPGFGGPQTPNTPAGTNSGKSDSMIVLNVDADKLPKAADVKSKMIPSMFSISLADREMRLTTRSAFPDLSVLIGMVPAFSMVPGVQSQVTALLQSQSPAPPASAAESPAAAPAASGPSTAPPARGPGRRGRRPD